MGWFSGKGKEKEKEDNIDVLGLVRALFEQLQTDVNKAMKNPAIIALKKEQPNSPAARYLKQCEKVLVSLKKIFELNEAKNNTAVAEETLIMLAMLKELMKKGETLTQKDIKDMSNEDIFLLDLHKNILENTQDYIVLQMPAIEEKYNSVKGGLVSGAAYWVVNTYMVNFKKVDLDELFEDLKVTCNANDIEGQIMKVDFLLKAAREEQQRRQEQEDEQNASVEEREIESSPSSVSSDIIHTQATTTVNSTVDTALSNVSALNTHSDERLSIAASDSVSMEELLEKQTVLQSQWLQEDEKYKKIQNSIENIGPKISALQHEDSELDEKVSASETKIQIHKDNLEKLDTQLQIAIKNLQQVQEQAEMLLKKMEHIATVTSGKDIEEAIAPQKEEIKAALEENNKLQEALLEKIAEIKENQKIENDRIQHFNFEKQSCLEEKENIAPNLQKATEQLNALQQQLIFAKQNLRRLSEQMDALQVSREQRHMMEEEQQSVAVENHGRTISTSTYSSGETDEEFRDSDDESFDEDSIVSTKNLRKSSSTDSVATSDGCITNIYKFEETPLQRASSIVKKPPQSLHPSAGLLIRFLQGEADRIKDNSSQQNFWLNFMKSETQKEQLKQNQTKKAGDIETLIKELKGGAIQPGLETRIQKALQLQRDGSEKASTRSIDNFNRFKEDQKNADVVENFFTSQHV